MSQMWGCLNVFANVIQKTLFLVSFLEWNLMIHPLEM
jgi:hypothetical protein